MKRKIKDILKEYLIYLYTLIGDIIFIFTIIFCIYKKVDWYYIVLICSICCLVLYFFNKLCITEIINKIKNKKIK